MRIRENMEKFIRIRKPHTATGSDTDRRILDDSFAAMDETIRAKSVDGKPNTCKRIVQSRITRIAAAAVIIVAIGFVIVHQAARRQINGQTFTDAAKSPAEMMTAMSLNLAYRKGGLEAVDKQCDRAFSMLGLKPSRISISELLRESNGEEPERNRL